MVNSSHLSTQSCCFQIKVCDCYRCVFGWMTTMLPWLRAIFKLESFGSFRSSSSQELPVVSAPTSGIVTAANQFARSYSLLLSKSLRNRFPSTRRWTSWCRLQWLNRKNHDEERNRKFSGSLPESRCDFAMMWSGCNLCLLPKKVTVTVPLVLPIRSWGWKLVAWLKN